MYESLLGRSLLNFIFFLFPCTSLRGKNAIPAFKGKKEVWKSGLKGSSKKTKAKEGIQFCFCDSLEAAYDHWFGAF